MKQTTKQRLLMAARVLASANGRTPDSADVEDMRACLVSIGAGLSLDLNSVLDYCDRITQ